MNRFLSHLDWSIYPATFVAVVNALLILPCIMLLPESYGYENGLLENLQMLVLFFACIFCFKNKENKKFFYFVALGILIIAIREVNCGRTLFFAIPNTVNEFYRWKDIKYGWLAHPLYGIYIASVVVYFFKHKCYIPLKNYITRTKLPVVNLFLMLVGMTLGLYAEKATHNFVFEEISELLFYVSLTGIIYLYSFCKVKNVDI